MKKFKTIKDFEEYVPFKENKENIVVLVGMGTCGKAAGADKVFDLLNKEIENRGIQNVLVKQVGCLGLCFCEVNVEVKVPGLPDILYGNVDEKFVIRIIEEHISGKKIINDNIIDKPYMDVFSIR